MNVKKEELGGGVVPLMAISYATYTIWEQYTGNYMSLTTDYTLILAVPAILISVTLIVKLLFPDFGSFAFQRGNAAKVVNVNEGEEKLELNIEKPEIAPGRFIRLFSLIGFAFALVIFLEDVGYHLTFGLFVASTLYMMNVRSVMAIIVTTAIVVLAVHFIFVGVLGLDLPLGLMETLLGEAE